MRLRDLLRGRRSPGEPPNYSPGSTERQVVSQRTIEYESEDYMCHVVESPDGSHQIGYGYSVNIDKSIILILSDDLIIGTHSSTRPTDAVIANDGTSLYIEANERNSLTNTIKILDLTGSTLGKRTIDANVDGIGISDDGQFAAVSTSSKTPIAYIFDATTGDLKTSVELRLNDVSLDGFQRGGDRQLLYFSDGTKPHVALDVNGDIVWESSKYQRTQSSLVQVREWLPG